MLLPLLVVLSFVRASRAQTLDVNGVSIADRILSMERNLYDPFRLNSIVEPCSLIFDDNPASGETTSAEWVRIVFHDFVTHNKSAGTGGLDASISFEADRDENRGIHFVQSTIRAFAQFYDVETSMSDLIALGLADSFISCDPGARFIKLKVGRKDATQAGPAGVPGPENTLEFATKAFAAAGFSQSDMIQAVACGHSLGNVHRANFPEIVDISVVNDNNLDGADPFDSTPFVFDNVGVNEYLNWTGRRGGPLSHNPNNTLNSDFRIFSSDGNATMKTLASPISFQQKCFTIFERMLDTVPSDVTLSPVIAPRPWILNEFSFDLSPAGVLILSGKITTRSVTAAPASAPYLLISEGGGNTGPRTSTGSRETNFRRGFGNTTNYLFTDNNIDPKVQSITVGPPGSSANFPLNVNLFVISSLSKQTTANGFPQYVVRAALLTTLAPAGTTLTATQYHRAPLPGSFHDTIIRDTATLTKNSTLGRYTVFEGVLTPRDTHPNAPGHIDVQGGGQRSAKVTAFDFGACDSTEPLSC